MTCGETARGWTSDAVRRRAEELVFSAFVQLDRSELSRIAIIDAAGLGTYSPAQDRGIARIDRALRSLVAAKRLVRVRKGVYSVVGREAAA